MAQSVKAQIPSHAAPAPKSAPSADKAPKAKKVRPPAPTVIPAWKDPKTGGVALVPLKRKDGTIKRNDVIRLKRDDFPSSTEGRQAFCDYQVAAWSWRRDNWAVRGSKDPAAKAERQLSALQTKLIKALCVRDGVSESDAMAKVMALLAKA